MRPVVRPVKYSVLYHLHYWANRYASEVLLCLPSVIPDQTLNQWAKMCYWVPSLTSYQPFDCWETLSYSTGARDQTQDQWEVILSAISNVERAVREVRCSAVKHRQRCNSRLLISHCCRKISVTLNGFSRCCFRYMQVGLLCLNFKKKCAPLWDNCTNGAILSYLWLQEKLALPGISYYLSHGRYLIHICIVSKEWNRSGVVFCAVGNTRTLHESCVQYSLVLRLPWSRSFIG